MKIMTANTAKRIAIYAVFFALVTQPAVGADRSIALILDASGSMNAKLPDGTPRIAAAKQAVRTLVTKLPDDIRLSFRAYGHQSHRTKKDCKDTQLLVKFDAAGANRTAVLENARMLKAQGYTPISHVLELAAADIKPETDVQSRAIILVSDGKETCPGDPCAVAKALTAADTGLVVHTVGFAVDLAAKYQLQCIAKVGRGTYFEAFDTQELAERLSEASRKIAITASAVKPAKVSTPGQLILLAPSSKRHEVISVETGKAAGVLGATKDRLSLPAGFYHAKFGNSLWKSLEVQDGKTTEINPAHLKIEGASYKGHAILDWETGELVEKVSSSHATAGLIPSTYLIQFGKLMWGPIELKAGERRVVRPGSVTVKGLKGSLEIKTEDGRLADTVSPIRSSATLPAGKYKVLIGEESRTFELTEGLNVELAIQ
jgi:von Willebrand factor type A domain